MRKLILLCAFVFSGALAFSQSPGGVTAGQILLPCPPTGSISCPIAGTIQVTANPSTIAVGATSQLGAIAFDKTNTQNINVTHQCVWTSSNTAVATVGDGTATAVGAGSATLNCTIGGISATVPVSVTVVNITINQPICGTPPCTLPPGVVGTAYSYTFLASGGSGIYTWSITAGSFSACGVTLNSSTGVLAGASPSASTCTATVEVTDTLSNTATVQVSLTIASTGPTCGPPNYPCTPTLQTQPGAFAPTQYPFSGFYSNCVPGPEPACSGVDNAIVTDPEPVSSGNNSGLYHSPIVRVTNAYTGCGNYTEPACGSTPATWNTFFVDSSAEVQHWNTNSTRFWLIDQSSNNYVFAFNPSTMQATFLYSSHQSCSGSPVTCNGMMWPNGASWSTTLQYIFYGMSTPNPGNANGCTLNKWDTTSTSVFPTPVQIYTFCGNSPNGVPASALYSTDPPSVGVVGGVDTVFIDGFSTSPSQNTARYYAAYKVGSGISVWNSLNNTVTGDWGSNNLPMICQNCVFSPLPISNITVSSSCNAFTHTCPATLTLTSVAGTNSGDIFTIAGNSQSCLNIAGLTATSVNASSLQITASVPVACGGVTGTGGTLTDTTPSPGTFSTHNVKASLKGDYVTVNVETCDPAPNVCYNGSGTPYLWQTGTNNVYTHCPLASGNDCSGHGATAALNYYQQFSIAFISQKAFTAPGTPTKFPSTLPCTANFTEEHLGVQSMLDGLDDGIVTGTSSSNNGAGNYANCLANEISGVFPPASPNSGQWKRFGHTYVVQTGCFGAQQAIGSVSQDGKFYMWPSPMNNALGCMNGSATGCTAVTSCQNTVASPRADVFIQELQ